MDARHSEIRIATPEGEDALLKEADLVVERSLVDYKTEIRPQMIAGDQRALAAVLPV